VHVVQSESWLNTSTTISTVLQYAPTKGESQVAFHRNASEIFSLGDTNPGKKDPNARRGYGQRNKSYMFKEGGVCSINSSSTCACSDVVDGNEEDNKVDLRYMNAYSNRCGMVLRLWNYPTKDVIHTGLSAGDEEGFFCFFQANKYQLNLLDKKSHHSARHHVIECTLMHEAIRIWKQMDISSRAKYKSYSESCKSAYHLIYLNESCFRYYDRQLAQQMAAINIETVYNTVQRANSPLLPLCETVTPSNFSTSTRAFRKKYLGSFDETTLAAEKVRYRLTKDSLLSAASQTASSSVTQAVMTDTVAVALVEYVDDLIGKADSCIRQGRVYYVTDKTRLPPNVGDARYYFSEKPTYWLLSDLLPDYVIDNKSMKQVDEDGVSYVIVQEDLPAPGTVIGGSHEEYYDRAKAWYLINNATTLALAWYFTNNVTYAAYGAKLVREFFLHPLQGMYPTLQFARRGTRTGLIDWKDFYVLMDAIVLLEWSGEFDLHDQKLMHSWCRHMINWYDVSPQGRGTGRSLTNHALIYDLSVLSLATYVSAADPSLAFVADATRTRLHYRLSQPAPLGHFTLNGQPFYDTGKPSALHDATTTIKCWLHLATVVEAIRANEQPAGAIESLWWTRHVDSSPQSQPQTAEALSQLSKPVLLKAVQWLLRYLPAESTAYFQYTTLRSSPTPETVDGGTRSIFNPEGVNGTLEVDAYYSFPYQQSTPFAYDRFLEIIHAACKIYGVEAVFPQTNSSSSGSGNNEVFAKRINAALSNDLYYNVHVASFTPYSSVDPSSGSRIWGELGIAARKTYK
jgi:hypothetical protein